MHHHEHRGMKEIREILLSSSMTDRAKEIALSVFEILAAAEAKAHGVPADQVHFHEVGAVDSIVDVAAAAICLDNLDVTEVIVPKLCEGTGTVRCQHGILPVPVSGGGEYRGAEPSEPPDHQCGGRTGNALPGRRSRRRSAPRTVLPDRFTIGENRSGSGKKGSMPCPGFLRAMIIPAGEHFREIPL